MGRSIIAVAAALIFIAGAAAITYVLSYGNLLLTSIIAAIVAVAGVMTAIFGFAKQIIEPIKLLAETKKLRWEGEEKKLAVQERNRRVVLPSPADVEKFGKPYRVIDRDLLRAASKTREILTPKNFVADSQETKMKGEP